MKMANINSIIKGYFRKNKIKLKDVANHLNISQSNLSERLSSNRSITLDQFFILFNIYGDSFAIEVMQHYQLRLPFFKKIGHLLQINYELKTIYNEIMIKNEEFFHILEEIGVEINHKTKGNSEENL